MTAIEVVKGNIVTMEFDAIVNAANSSLLGVEGWMVRSIELRALTSFMNAGFLVGARPGRQR